MDLPHDTLARMKMLASLNGLSDSDESAVGSTAVLDDVESDAAREHGE
ncbi:MAG: hypothetical protein O2820_11860 [Planctomycetota bacterium]|nr:hypothetical protein [Planctomycetota bacterium]MDA1249906.1 hypothetical protein [Planctomycetota bacterium]